MNVTLDKYDSESVTKYLDALLEHIHKKSEGKVTATICILDSEKENFRIISSHKHKMIRILEFALKQAVDEFKGEYKTGEDLGDDLIKNLNRLKELLIRELKD